MIPTTETLEFLRLHREDDPLKLLLNKAKYPEVDMDFVAQQIEGTRQARSKWPSLLTNTEYWYPPKLNREQSSSEKTARYKADLVKRLGGGLVADLTGGMGIDACYIAESCSKLDYCEMDEHLCQLADHNFQTMRHGNITCHNVDSMNWLENNTNIYNTILIDPARRDRQGNKVAAFADCQPNIITHWEMLKNHAHHIIIKASPMIDLHQAQRELDGVSEVHILAVDGECKEVLFVISAEGEETSYHCTDITKEGTHSTHFTLAEEESAEVEYCQQISQYLFEPHAALMKGGAYKTIGQRYKIAKLARNTHLYTADKLVVDFPGRIFKVLAEVALQPKSIAEFIPEKKAHVISRNYPIEAATLQKKLKLKEGGELFIIATTMGSALKGFICERVAPPRSI